MVRQVSGDDNQRLRVCLLADSPLPTLLRGADGRGGGQAATWLPPLAEHLAGQHELEVHWIFPGNPAESAGRIEWNGITFHGFKQIHPKLDLILGLRPTRNFLAKMLGKLQPDLIHVWGSERRHSSVLESWQGRSVFSLQGNLNRYRDLRVLHQDWAWRKMADYERRWVRRADIVTAESPWAVEAARELAPGLDVRRVEYGVPDSFRSLAWQPAEDDPYLLFCGAVDWRKGMDVLFDALDRLPDRRWRLKIAGDGPMKHDLESRKSPGVDWLGSVPWQELQRVMAGAWGLVIPTRADTGPTVVKEARVMGLPVIGSTYGGLRDYVVNEVNGYVVDPLSPEELATACDRLMSEYSSVLALGRGHHQEDLLQFSTAATAESFVAIYRELAATPKHR